VIEQLKNKGYSYSSGILSPDSLKFIVNIPKNASSYILDWAKHHNWTTTEIDNDPKQQYVNEVIVILRDPLQRWVSGMGQYLTSYVLNVTGAYSWETGPGPDDQFMPSDEFIKNYNSVVERLLFDNLNRHDDHVWPQIEFFENLLPSVPRKYFYIDQNFNTKFREYLKFDHIDGLDANIISTNPHTEKVQQFIKGRLNTRPELTQRVIDAYTQDYKLIEKVLNE
jgi:hypothetical protein